MATYTTVYPSPVDATTVKATSEASSLLAWYAMHPSALLTGGASGYSWSAITLLNQKFNADLGAEVIIRRIYLENFHHNGTLVDGGVKNVLVYGSNDPTVLSDLDYSSLANLTEIGSFQAAMHIEVNSSDPQYFLLNNSIAYRYIVIRIADNWGNSTYLGVRQIEYQTEDNYIPPVPIVGDGQYYSYLPAIDGVGIVDSIGRGKINTPRVSITGLSFNSIIGTGHIIPPINSIYGNYGANGHIVPKNVIIESIGVVPIIGIGKINSLVPSFTGYMRISIIGASFIHASVPTINSYVEVPTIGIGNIKPKLCAISSYGYITSIGMGNILTVRPTIFGRINTPDSHTVIHYHREGICR